MAEDTPLYAPVDAAGMAMRNRCPRCGEGRLFKGFLSLKPACSHCGLDYAFIDSGDGPAVFVILIISFVVVGLALYTEVTWNPPLWIHFLLWIPLTLVLCLPLLRLLKGLMIGLQFRNKAAPGRLETDDDVAG
ncbi:hypothetical protein ASG43_03750 [Aureimonas sp. Leaf454]|uniref:DUF983 domain-containing protein n=1 Tax=Aureimonas sp. Leaf454 TaxID=1736381 RepID=UPI0006FB0ACE|nr:DUF983 domain-containing protein [Aureimonas sp. Leaf454]KQT54698.1 hypothetical protein ASG43_03750 [Aureimonas sp. Leaf454]